MPATPILSTKGTGIVAVTLKLMAHFEIAYPALKTVYALSTRDHRVLQTILVFLLRCMANQAWILPTVCMA